MAIRRLVKAQWKSYFDNASRILAGKRVELEVASLGLGDKIEAEWLPLFGIVYDPKDNLIEIALEGTDHLIRNPQEVHVDEGSHGVNTLRVVDSDGIQHIVQLREPLALPPPEASSP